MLLEAIRVNIDQLISLLDNITEEQYQYKSKELGDSSVGQHVRHIIEMYQCLLNNYDSGQINYDLRERNMIIETRMPYAKDFLLSICRNIDKKDKPLALTHSLQGKSLQINSHYNRELLYNLEHSIHHQALIKVALMAFEELEIPEYFGVAPSTIEYRKECAQ